MFKAGGSLTVDEYRLQYTQRKILSLLRFENKCTGVDEAHNICIMMSQSTFHSSELKRNMSQHLDGV